MLDNKENLMEEDMTITKKVKQVKSEKYMDELIFND